jgi:hypothetical protein
MDLLDNPAAALSVDGPSDIAYRHLIDTIAELEAARDASARQCKTLQGQVAFLIKKLKAMSSQHTLEALGNMEAFRTAMTDANRSHNDECCRLEEQLATAHASVIAALAREGTTIPPPPVLGARVGLGAMHLDVVERGTSPDLLPRGFSMLGRARRTMDEETQTCVAHVTYEPQGTEPPVVAADTPRVGLGVWIRPVAGLFPPPRIAMMCAAQPNDGAAALSDNIQDNDGLHSPDITSSRQHPSAPLLSPLAPLVPRNDNSVEMVSNKVAALVEQARSCAARPCRKGIADYSIRSEDNPADLLLSSRLRERDARENVVAQRDATIHALQMSLAAAQQSLTEAQRKHRARSESSCTHRSVGINTLANTTTYRDVASHCTFGEQAPSLPSNVEAARNAPLLVEDDARGGAAHDDAAPASKARWGSKRESALTPLRDEIILLQEENRALHEERASILSSQMALLARIGDLERHSALVLPMESAASSLRRCSSIVVDTSAAEESLSPLRQHGPIFFRELVETNKQLHDDLLRERAAATLSKVSLGEATDLAMSLTKRVEVLELSNTNLKQDIGEYEFGQQRSTQSILHLQQYLRERNSELRLLKDSYESLEKTLASQRDDAAAKEASLQGHILQLSERLRQQLEAHQLQEYRENRNVVSLAAFEDLQEQVEAYRQQERAVFDVLLRLTAADAASLSSHTTTNATTTSRGGQLTSSVERSAVEQSPNVLELLLEWSSRRSQSIGSNRGPP